MLSRVPPSAAVASGGTPGLPTASIAPRKRSCAYLPGQSIRGKEKVSIAPVDSLTEEKTGLSPPSPAPRKKKMIHRTRNLAFILFISYPIKTKNHVSKNDKIIKSVFDGIFPSYESDCRLSS
ncbi:MAG TPA: hypothetical protein DEG28_06250 [Porphyromonadaceae bacterium]|nr:hypothetical protein [Porphyromonadaceae bacterium]